MKKSTLLYKKFILLLTLLLLIGGFSVDAWGANVAQTTTTIANKGTSATGNGITFSLTGTHRIEPILNRYAYLKADEEFTLSWSGVPTGYTINVTQLKIRTYRENKKKTIGKYKTYKNTTYAVFTETETDENDRYLNSSSYFPLGNEGYITVRAEGDVLQYRDMTFTYTIGNNYSIRFNGNGSTSGSMSDLSMAYYVAKNLTANAYTRSYAISYDAGDGELDAEPTAANTASSYTFEGWATTPGGTKAYNDGQSVQNLTDEVNEVVDLYAKWSGGGVTLPTGTRDGYFLAGWNKGGVRVGRPGETYYPEGGTSAITLVADWQENITPEFDGDGAEDVMKVGDTYTGFSFSNTSTSKPTNNSDDVFYYIIDNIDVNDHVEGCASGKEDSVISYNPSTNTLTALNAGTADITFYHKAVPASHVVASSTTFSITVEKYSNTISCNWDGWSKSDIRFDEEISTIISSTNSDGYASLTVTPTAGTNVARYDGANNKVVALYDEGTATWSISQAEDYKYYAAETKTLSLTVAKDPNCGCNIYTYAGTDNSTTVDNLDCNWTEVGVADSLFFQLRKRGAGRRCQLDVGYKDNGTTKYVGFKEYRAEDDDYYHEFKDDVHDNAIKLQFRQYYTSDPYIKDIRVTRKRWFNIKNAAGDAEITELSMPSRILTGDSTVATFKVDYSTCASTIKVASNNPHIVVAASDRSFSSTTHGERTITLKYSSTEVESITDAVVTIYTPYEHKTLTVKAKTKVLSTTLEYKGASSYAVDHADMLATDLFQVRDENGDLVASPTITLISNATGVINTLSSNTAIDFICGGSATITASFAGVANMYEAASNLGQTITVNKLADAISWSGVGNDGKIHVWADTDIPTSIASANSDIASYSVASANPYLSVTEEDGVYTLHAGIVGEVALTATSAGDCMYATASGSKTIAVDPREHAIIWDQDLEGIQTDDRGYIINRRITLNAYAVDNESNPTNVPVSYAITGGGTFATIENGNELVINVANLSGTLSTTITATTTVGTKYAIVSETKTISVVRWGTNTAKSADNTSDIVDGKIVINAPHATFTFSGETDITEFGYATVFGKPEGYKLAQSLDNNGGSKTYNFSWVSTNANCSIQVNKISFWIKAYDSDAFVSNKAKVSFDGAAEESVGTAAMTANDGDFKHFSKPENYTNRNVPVVCRVTGYENFDFYIKNISIEYTVYTTAPSATSGIEEVDRTINASDKQTVDVRDLFSYAVAPPSDFEYSYEIVGAPEHAFLEGGYMFWADAVGDYTVRAKVNMDEDHRESEWGSEKTIRVNKVPYVFNNSAEDQKWDTKNNWTISSWPIENLPTEDDDVIVRGHLTIDEEITINSMTIDACEGFIVEIAPTGGLTVGAGGVIGATSDNLILKAGTSGVEKGQTGYLRISPDYAGAMPEATVELFSVSYYDQAAGADNSAVWQGVGSPISEAGVLAKSVYTSCWVYSWDEATDGWVNNRATLKLTPFVGFSTTQKKEPEGRKYTYEGHLVSGAAPVTMDLAYTAGHGTNLLANSWAAPISIPNFESSDFVNAAHTIYILNAGTKAQSDAPAGGFTAPGKYIGVPIKTASELAASGYPVVIPSMQGFWVQAEGASAQLRLDYSRLVWGADYSGDGSNQPLRAPKHNAEASPVTGKMKVSISAGGWSDFIFLLESEKYMPEYEDGYDAIKIPSGGMDLFTVEGENYLGVDATNSIIGTRVGVRTSEETAYTLFFSHLKSESDMSLWDLEADQKIEINEGTTYTFFAEPNAEITDRFLIIERAGAPTNTTGVDDAEDEANVHKFIKDNQLYILKNGVLYNGTGARVK